MMMKNLGQVYHHLKLELGAGVSSSVKFDGLDVGKKSEVLVLSDDDGLAVGDGLMVPVSLPADGDCVCSSQASHDLGHVSAM
jgi:hypothetical protein